MKKHILFLSIISAIFIFGCKTGGAEVVKPSVQIPEKPELKHENQVQDVTIDLLTEPKICNWDNAYHIKKDNFKDYEPGDKVEFSFKGTDDYCRVRFMHEFMHIEDGEEKWEWIDFLFNNLDCSPEAEYIHQIQDYEGNHSDISKIKPFWENNYTEHTVVVTFTEDDLKILKEWGLILTGDNFELQYVKLYTKQTVEIYDLSFDEQYEAYEDYRNAIIETYSRKYNVPMIFITTENRESVVTKDYYNAVIDVVNCDDEFILSKKGGVKVRGNSTADNQWAPTIKPYRIKFNKKQNMLGLHGGKKYKSWVLLKAEGFTASDYLGFNLAHEIYKTSEYPYYASDCTFVHVFVNDEYKAVYLLCEQNQVNEGRVDVYPNEEMSTDVKTGYMLELDNYAWNDISDGKGRWFGNGCSKGLEDYHFNVNYCSKYEELNGKQKSPWGEYYDEGVLLKDVNGETRVCIEDSFTLKNDIYDDLQVEFIQKYTKNLWDMCHLAIEKQEFYKFDDNYDLVEAPEFTKAFDVLDAAIDMESLCNEMILEELVRDNDVGAGSLYMAIDFTKTEGEKYHKFTFECPWDFNWGYQPISNDMDGGAYWTGKTQYFAGGWQTVELLEDRSDRSHPWFVLLNKDPDVQKMLRQKWNRIGAANLKAVADLTDRVVKNNGKDIGGADASGITDFVRNRIDYINTNLWK